MKLLTTERLDQVDALCINQADQRECSAQVMRMRGIYAGAHSVLAAIDATSEDAEHILQAVSLAEPVLDLENEDPGLVDLLDDETTLPALRTFCNDGYRNRVWIIQEFAVSPNLQLLVGNATVRAERLDSFLALLRSLPHQARWNSISALFHIRNVWQTNRSIPMTEMLYETSKSLCGRRHDHVFGLMGLVPDGLEFCPSQTTRST
jgi:hypothetical protein